METEMTRRRFLQNAALGVAAAHASLRLPQIPGSVDVSGGILLSKGNGWIELSGQSGGKPFTLTGATKVWKGEPQPSSSLAQGDEVIVRYDQDTGQALQIWANIARISGQIVAADATGYLIQSTDPHRAYLETRLTIANSAEFAAQYSPAPARVAGKLYVGDVVDAVGERTPASIRATLLSVIPPEAGPVAPSVLNKYVRTSPAGCSYYGWLGYVSYYTCATGGGRCGTCNASSSSQLAWPAIDFCGCCTSSCCDCSRNCNDQCHVRCGDTITVFDNGCSSKSRNCSVVDCGPCQENNCSSCTNLCNRSCSVCGQSGIGAVADLTAQTFAYFYNISQVMCFPATVQTTCITRCN